MKTRNGQYFLSRDNGSLFLVGNHLGIEAVRHIDLKTNQLLQNKRTYTYPGRDILAYTGARLAAGLISFDEVGSLAESQVARLHEPTLEVADGKIVGDIPFIDATFGNVESTIDVYSFENVGFEIGDTVAVVIRYRDGVILDGNFPYQKVFGDVAVNQALVYVGSNNLIGVALNQGNFATIHNIGAGIGWTIEFSVVQATGKKRK